MWGFPDSPTVPDVYMAMYNASAVGLKAVHPGLRVGGPATAQTQYVADFVKACKAQHLPLDFVTTHFVSSHDSNTLGVHCAFRGCHQF
jgi:beta-xylosidase